MIVFFNPIPRLSLGAESVLKRHVRSPEQTVGADMFYHLGQRRPYFLIGVIDKIPQADGKADLQAQIRILKRCPDGIRQGYVGSIEEHAPGKAVGDTAYGIRVPVHPPHKDTEFIQIALLLIRPITEFRPGPEREKNRDI